MEPRRSLSTLQLMDVPALTRVTDQEGENQMKPKLLVERGQALILITLAAVGLFAITGLAIDGGIKFSDRRHAQNAADSAALAGALAKSTAEQQILSGATLTDTPIACPDASPSDVCSAILGAARARATENGYDGDLVRSVVGVYRPPMSGVYSNCSDVHFDCNDYVQVIIDSNIDTFFSRVIGINQTHNHVEAVASTISAKSNFNFGGNAMVALKSSGCDALKAQGGSQIKFLFHRLIKKSRNQPNVLKLLILVLTMSSPVLAVIKLLLSTPDTTPPYHSVASGRTSFLIPESIVS